MKLIIRLIIIGALTYFITPLSFWWMGMIVSFLVCYISPSSGLNAFVAGFLGVGLVWMGQAWIMDVKNESAFTSTIAEIMQFSEPIYLVFLSGLVGGLSGGFSATSGSTFRQIFRKKKQRSFYS